MTILFRIPVFNHELVHEFRNAEGGYMQWVTPNFADMRFGFEIAMYIAAR
jgi:coenzyme PQQ precursor peptide PqqA